MILLLKQPGPFFRVMYSKTPNRGIHSKPCKKCLKKRNNSPESLGHLRGFPDYLPVAGFRNCPYHDSTGRTGFPQLSSQLSPKKPTRIAILNPAAPICPEDFHKSPPWGLGDTQGTSPYPTFGKRKTIDLCLFFQRLYNLKTPSQLMSDSASPAPSFTFSQVKGKRLWM